MKRILTLTLAALMLLTACANSSAKDKVITDISTEESNLTVSDKGMTSESETARADDTQTVTYESGDDALDPLKLTREEWIALPDGKEVTIFADNTLDCDYSDYKIIKHGFKALSYSVKVPVSWNGFRFCRYQTEYEQTLNGIPIYDGSVPVEADYNDVSTYLNVKPEENSVFFLAETPLYYADDYVGHSWISEKYDHETYVDKKGRSMEVYYFNGLPKFARYNNFFCLCIWFNLKSEEQIPIVVNMINSLEVSMSRDAEYALHDAQRLGYTIEEPDDSSSAVLTDDLEEADTYSRPREDLSLRPDGKEVTIFADNTFDCDYSGYKEIGYDFEYLHRSIMAPEDWYGFLHYRDSDPRFENSLNGIPIYDRPITVDIDCDNNVTRRYSIPEDNAVVFFAQSPWPDPRDYLGKRQGLLVKYDHETYIDKKGRSMQVYYLDGLPVFACYDDFLSLCVCFNLKSEEQIPIAVNMINSIDVSMSWDGLCALYRAKRLGYSITLPENVSPEDFRELSF